MTGVDPELVGAWLAGRSLARGLPPPVRTDGGWRVDTASADELCRYVFAAPGDGLVALGNAISSPRIAIKLCRAPAALAALLPPRWRVEAGAGASLMTRDMRPTARGPVPDGYGVVLRRNGPVWTADVLFGDLVVASGFAAETCGVFVYDRIVVEEAHRRRGVGRLMMAALADCRESDAAREVLVATPAGSALYATLGWRRIAPYSTAMIANL